MELTYSENPITTITNKIDSGVKLLITIPALLWIKGMPFRLFLVFLTANTLIPIGSTIEKYIYNDWDFGVVVVFLLIIEALLGWAKHYKLKTLDKKYAMWGIVQNIMIVIGFSFLFHALRFSLIESGTSPEEFMTKYLRLLKQLIFISYFGLSMSVSLFIVTNGKFPPGFFIRRLKKFKDTGNIDELLNQETSRAEKEYKKRGIKDN